MIPSELLVSAYRRGWFPMAVDGGEIRWYSPDPRGIIPLDGFHVPSLRVLLKVNERHDDNDGDEL